MLFCRNGEVMFKIGEFVVNANNGICEIKDKVIKEIMGDNKEYYLIVPIEESTAKIYIPVDKAEGRIRRVMSENDAYKIIDDIPHIPELWIDNEKQREQHYKEAIASCEPKRLISIIKSMYHRNQERSAQGKKHTVIDDRYFKIAENNLYSELAFSIGKEKCIMETFINERIGTI